MALVIKSLKILIRLFCCLSITCVMLSMTFLNSHIKITSLSQKNMKYILIWSRPDEIWNILDIKQKAFKKYDCEYKNCYITYNKKLLNNVNKDFTAVLINGKKIALNNTVNLPDKKKLPYKYSIFVMKESAAVHPVCNPVYDSFFNLTWTYRLDSDVVWTPFIIYDKNENEIGPKINMIWNANPGFEVRNYSDFVMRKKYTAAWFVSECETQSKREGFFDKLKSELKLYKLDVQVVGLCGSRECPDGECEKRLNQFYFHFAYENSIAEDYVTEEILKSLLNHVVPVVFGGANYSRFLPPNSYINSLSLGPRKTAYTMLNLIKNKDLYVQHLKWNDHYYYTKNKKPVCDLCELVNRREVKVYRDFRLWWNPNYEKHCNKSPQKLTMLYPSYDNFF